MRSPLFYRPDIDGLRALSVLAVIAFHMELGSWFKGGFVGVDVFFVISGFLITNLIAKDLEQGTFSFVSFWERRIRCIWPAAMAMTVAVLVAGFVIMLPVAFSRLAEDSLSQIVMLANVQFWYTSDYFSAHSNLRPLLHTWSLAVEEQFYFFFPSPIQV